MIFQITLYMLIACIVILVISIILLFFVVPMYIKEHQDTLSHLEEVLSKKDDRIKQMLEELSQSKNKIRINELMKLITYENKQILKASSNKILKHKAQHVLTWSNHFSVDKHIDDLLTTKTSSQIYYDKENKTFQLSIPHKK
ncbi:MAG: hypothetical protein ACRCV0_03805 [Brevinema sp.]